MRNFTTPTPSLRQAMSPERLAQRLSNPKFRARYSIVKLEAMIRHALAAAEADDRTEDATALRVMLADPRNFFHAN